MVLYGIGKTLKSNSLYDEAIIQYKGAKAIFADLIMKKEFVKTEIAIIKTKIKRIFKFILNLYK